MPRAGSRGDAGHMTTSHTTGTPERTAPTASAGRALAWTCGGLAVLFGLAGGLFAWQTHHDIATAGARADTSLYGLGYVLAAAMGGLAAAAAIGALAGWLASRRAAGAAQVALVVLAVLMLLPMVWFLGLLL